MGTKTSNSDEDENNKTLEVEVGLPSSSLCWQRQKLVETVSPWPQWEGQREGGREVAAGLAITYQSRNWPAEKGTLPTILRLPLLDFALKCPQSPTSNRCPGLTSGAPSQTPLGSCFLNTDNRGWGLMSLCSKCSAIVIPVFSFQPGGGATRSCHLLSTQITAVE